MLAPLLKLKSIVNGYNIELAPSMNYPEDYLNSSYIPYKIEAMGYTEEATANFYANINIMVLLVLLVPIVALSIKIASKFIDSIDWVASHVAK